MRGYGQREVNITLFGKKLQAREIILPMPPSENERLQGRVIRGKCLFHNTKTYNVWLERARQACMKGKLAQYEEEVTVFVTVVFPDNRRRDNQNREKPLFDAMTKSGCVYKDDCLIKQHFTREEVIKGQSFVLVYVVPYKDLTLDEFGVTQDYLLATYEQAVKEEKEMADKGRKV